jgi:hypothetical protein
VLRERRDAAVAELRSKTPSRLGALGGASARGPAREREQSQATSQTTASAISIAGSVLGALLGGRRSSAIGKAGTAVRSYGRIEKERADVAQARADAEATHQQVAALNAELEGEIERVSAGLDPQKLPIDKVSVKPRKSDIAVEDVALVWRA